jgi:multidrug efflux pump subunit AcrB
MIEVRARAEDGFLPDEITKGVRASQEYKDLIASLPGGHYVELGGMLENTVESAEQMSVSHTITVLSIILLPVIQYNGWAKPAIILSTLPLALIGVFVGLYLTGNNLGFMPQLGVLSLFGIVVNTAIIYIEVAELTVQERSEESDGSGPIVGLTKAEFLDCLDEAGRQRLMPIALTTLTTVLGLCPLAFFGGPLWEGMAWAMIFGLLLATVLTLVVVPSLYAIFTERFGMLPCKPRN